METRDLLEGKEIEATTVRLEPRDLAVKEDSVESKVTEALGVSVGGVEFLELRATLEKRARKESRETEDQGEMRGTGDLPELWVRKEITGMQAPVVSRD